MFQIFDVYNNGFSLGGRLRVIPEKTVVLDDNILRSSASSPLQEMPKYRRRNDLSDITIKFGVIVSAENGYVYDCCELIY